tara:strand:+ start:364 stop:546 length:183 start_codon:yes stop_codon:yes gene_type:complete
MKKIIEYSYEEGEKLNELCERVNASIKEGWQPLRGVNLQIAREGNNYRTFYTQSIVIYED